MSATPRPCRTTANFHPAAILLQDKRSRRTSAEVAKEKADNDAKRQEILDKQAASLRELAALEEQLKAQDSREGQPVVPAQSTAKENASPTKSVHLQALARPRSGRASVVDGPKRGTTDNPTQKSSSVAVNEAKPKSASSGGKLKRATRADVDAYRIPEVPSTPDAFAGLTTQTIPSKPSAGSRKSKRKIEKLEQGLEVPLTKKGKMTKPSGVTPAAALKFSLPQSGLHNGALLEPASSTPSTPVHPGSTVHTEPSGSNPAPNVDVDLSTSAVGVTVEYGGGYVSDREDVVEVGPVSGSLNVNKPASGNMKVEIVDVTVSSAPAQPLFQTVTGMTATNISAAPFENTTLAARPLVKRRNGAHWTMSDIDQLLGPYAGNFTLSFLPKLIYLIGNGANGPWRLYGLDLPSAMKDIAEEVFPTLTATIDVEIVPRRVFYEVAKQKLSEYRNGVANEAIEVVNRYMQSEHFSTTEERADFVAWALTNSQEMQYPFRYYRVYTDPKDGTLDKQSVYEGKLVAYTFGYHLRRTGLRADRFRDFPCNALALATTAVERALKMWETGSLKRPKPRSEEAKFSDRLWGSTATEYLAGITDLDEGQWDGILGRAEHYVLSGELSDTSEDDDSGDEDDDQDFFDLPMTGGRANIDDDRQTAREAAIRGTIPNVSA
ncbi:hypothetical protein C8Q79DRAFT_1043120 [Trametes meyenii]|nr:hypothetical protein C8Q79DRAFT_1043120 [Trametes meyenii]